METRRRSSSSPWAPLGCGLSLGALLLLQGSVLFRAYALDVELKDEDNITCLFAKWYLNISIMYESTDDEYKIVDFMFPDTVRYDGSSCGNETYGPVLAMEFGDDHSWSIHFTKSNGTYQGRILFTYNTNDTDLFPDAERQGLITTSVNFPERPVELDTVFTCHNMESFESDNITQDFSDVSLQVFVAEGVLSSKTTKCDIDLVPATAHITATATTTATTTASATATTTTTTTTTNTTTANVTTTESNTTIIHTLPTFLPLLKPETGNYSLKNGSSICLLATMGLQLNITQKVPLIINFDPNRTVASGTCGTEDATLTLKDANCWVDFIFALKESATEIYLLREVNITVLQPQNATLSAANRSLDYWETTVGNSYMCRKEETVTVTPEYSLNVYDLKIQPFEVKDNEYAAAQECLLDDDTVLIPIVVGAALAGLIVIIVLAYIIGRRKNYTGYQTL